MSTRLERVCRIDAEIRRGTYPSVKKLCDMFEVQERTLYDDIRFLKDRMGQDIEFDRSKAGYFNKNPEKTLPSFELTNAEVFALTIGKDMLSAYTGTSFEPILKSALEKIYQRLPGKVEVNIEELRSMIRFKPNPLTPVNRKAFLDLNRACEKNLPTELKYYAPSTDEVTERTIYPHRLVEHQGLWYVVGFCTLRQALRKFALHRIQHYHLLDARFEPIPDQEIDNWLAGAFMIEHREAEQLVKVKFAPRAANYVRERVWHNTQTIDEHTDGSCTLSMQSPSLDEVARWVLSYGAEAEVLAPPQLRERMRSTLVRALEKYGQN